MASQVTCECGFVARAGSDEEVVVQVREHIDKDHPELIETVTPEVIRGWIQVVD